MQEVDYPYSGAKTTCKYVATKGITTVTGSSTVIRLDPDALLAAVTIRPVAVGISASSTVFQFYKTGVISDAVGCGTAINHAVVIVGYGSTSTGQPYWIIKNSWGIYWGDNGYVKV